ncbi:hypothetical protein CUN37_12715 [Enterococcus faecium]|nr:hypothetical protein CUN37_12715 [Enterococcus faecium]
MNKKMMKFSLLSVSLILTSAGAVTSAIPSMSATYVTRSLSAVELLTTAPSFMVTIFVLISSFIARKIGQKQTVIIGLVIASICGILPLFSQSYSIVLASRAGLGIGFGLINSLAVSMIAAFYHGDERASMIGFQSAFQGFGAALMTFVAGQLVQLGWQYTFLIYAISLPILVLFVLFVPTPETTELQSHGTAPTRQVIKTNPKMISYGIFLLLVIVVYNAVSIKLATVLTTYSLGNETNAANILTIMQLASMAAGVCFGWLQTKAHRYMLTLSLLLMGIGFVLIATVINLYVIGFGAILTGISFSLFIPYLFNQVSIQAPKHAESFNTSILLVGANLGTFIAPYGLLFLSFASLGSKTLAVFVNGSILLLISALISLLVVHRTNRKMDIDYCYYKQIGMTRKMKARKRAFRYLFIPEVSTGMVQLQVFHEFLSLSKQAAFSSDSSLLNQIWSVSEETFKLCSDLFFIDGIKRDRWIWSGDAYQSFMINQYLFFDEEINKRTILALRGQNEIKQHMNTIVDYSILWLIGIENHYMMTKDYEFLCIVYPKMQSLMRYLMEQTNELGFIYGRAKDWIFIDWSEMDKEGTLAAEQVLLLKAYQSMITCGDILAETYGENENYHTHLYQEKYQLLKQNLFDYFWDEELGAFIDCYESGRRNVTRHANIFAVLFDFANKDQQQSILKNVLLNDTITQITTPYFKFYEQDALCKLGQTNIVYQTILDYWGGMLSHDAVTFWEEYDPTQTGNEKYSMYGDPYGKSLCHAWGASPIYLLGRYFIGLYPTKPGYE